MTEIDTFLRLAETSFSVAARIHLGWLVPVIAIPVILGVTGRLPFRARGERMKDLLLFAPLLFAVLLLVYGAIFTLPPGVRRLHPEVIGHPAILYMLCGGAIVSAGIAIWTLERHRLLAIAIVWIELWYVFWCGFVTAMVVTGTAI